MEQQRIFLLLSLILNMSYFFLLLSAPAPSGTWKGHVQRAAPYFGGFLVWAALMLVLRTFGPFRFDAVTIGMFFAAAFVNLLSVRFTAAQDKTVVSGKSQSVIRQLGISVGMGAVFSVIHFAVFANYLGGRPDWFTFFNGVGFFVAFVFLTMRLVEQLRIDQTERSKAAGAGKIVYLSFLMSHGMLGCALTIFESFGLVDNYDFFIVEFVSLFVMTITTVIVGERQYLAKRDQLEWKNKQLRHIAYHDSLTGLPNRMYITEYLEERVRSGEPCFVMLIDLDQFKHVNDWLGHQAGDFLLVETARRLLEAMGSGEVVGRLGGDEFLVVGSGRTEEATAAAERILRTVPMPLDYEGHKLLVTTSVGVSLVPTHAATAVEAMKRADIAMYRAKEKGRDAFHVFSEASDLVSVEDQRMKQELKGALRGCDFELYYQPQMEVRTGRIVGFEALLRWNREEGPIGPEKFISLAEQNGAIVGIGEWALRHACAQIRAWNDAFGAKLRVSVNVSFEQLRKGDFVDKVKAILVESGLDGSLLELELKESAAMRDEEQIRRQVDELRGLGVQIGIDDFGTGYSAFAYMRRIAVDRLKIDKSFVEGLPRRAEDQAIVKAMLAMAQELKLKTTAEGVERDDQLAYLASIGCDEIQGYFYSKPLRSDAVTELLANQLGHHS